MRFRDLYRMAKENLMRRKLRTSLTILSIVIGTISIVLMIALGVGMQEAVVKEFDSYGSLNVLQVSKEEEATRTSRFYEENAISGLSEADLLAMEEVEGVELAVPLSSALVTIYSSAHSASAYLVGVDPVYMEEMGFVTSQGRLPRDNVNEVIFGDEVLKSFEKLESENPNNAIQRPEEKEEETEEEGIVISFGEDNKGDYLFKPLEERYKMQINIMSPEESEDTQRLYSINGVGVLKEGDIMKDSNVYMPMGAFEKMVRFNYEAKGIAYKPSYSQVLVRITEIGRVKEVKEILEDKGYSVFSLMSVLDSVTKTIQSMKVALGAIGGISLFVAAIGITNTMVMAITERKKEIGVMKVIGATFIDIRRLFLLEAALIGLIGGGVGISICVAISSFINSDYFQVTLLQFEQSGSLLTISNSLIVGCLVFTTLIGILSGYLPAIKAMRSSALEAIRND